MRRIRFILLLAAIVTLLGIGASAALTEVTFNQKEISLDAAQMIAQGAIDKCRADGFKVSVTILDAGNEVKVYLHDDGATQVTIEGSRRKAYTALVYKRTSADIGKARGTELLSVGGDVTGIGGGVPIKAGNDFIGAIGVGGATVSGEDEVCANAGIAKIADKLQ